MKHSMLLLAILATSCSTAPPEMSPLHPFPKTFTQVIVSFHDIPEDWTNSYSEQLPNFDTSEVQSGFGLKSGTWTFDFDNATFRYSGDTIKADISHIDIYLGTVDTQLTAVIDPKSDIIDFLHVAVSSSLLPFSNNSTWTGLDCKNLAYQTDSLNRIVVTLFGQAVTADLVDLGSESTNDFVGEFGTDNDDESEYTDTTISTASITIQFIP